METPLSGSHLGPHTRPQRPCNKAVSRQAVCSRSRPSTPPACPSTAHLHRAHQRQIRIRLDRRGSPS